ncbi:MAG TPA: Ig-like domain-containing protein, partial [Verrucomicrobiae bacterium]|nr:Ig-like domain-containing protein [Verrucomicrobiae bacterium]
MAACLLTGIGTYMATAASPTAPQGVITAKEFLNIGGTTLADLTNNASFPNNPDLINYSTVFEWPALEDGSQPVGDVKNNYGIQIIGYFYPTVTGAHTFYLAADDNAVLYLSTDSNPANKKVIARETAWSPVRAWDSTAGGSDVNAKNSSLYTASEWPGGGTAINLTANQPYYIEALVKEGGGGDSLAVSIDGVSPIPGTQLSSIDKTFGNVSITTQPQSQTVLEGAPVIFSVVADGTPLWPSYAYQWKKGGVDILDATNHTYSIQFVSALDNGAQFTVTVTGAAGSPVTSNPATLTVNTDTTPPTIVSAAGGSTSTSPLGGVSVVFSERMDATSVGTAGNYGISGGVTISSVIVLDDTRVVLRTSAQVPNTTYTLTVSNVKDRAATPNTIAANSTIQFSSVQFVQNTVQWQIWNGGITIGALTNNLADGDFGRVPDRAFARSLFESGRDLGDNYGARGYGWFKAPAGGDYVFYITVDDNAQLFLSTDDNPANKQAIAAEATWSDNRTWTAAIGTEQASDSYPDTQWPTGNTITLVQNQYYYLEAQWQEGGGGDGAEVTYKMVSEADPATGAASRLTGSAIGIFLDLSTVVINITQQPQNATILENSTATFTVAASGTSTPSYQWQKAAPVGAFSDIAGATSSTYTTSPLTMADNGARYRAVVTILGATRNSAEAVVTIQTDTVPPTLVSARRSFADNTKVTVVFSELMQAASANIPANYTINNGITVSAAALQTDGKSVVLTASPIARGTTNTLTVTGVRDLAGNQIAASAQITIGFERGALFVLSGTDPATVNASDGILQSRLESRGYFVEVASSVTDDVSMATGKDIVIISSTVPSGNVLDTYKDVAVPVIDWEQAVQDDMAWTTVGGTTDRGTTTGQTMIDIVNATHPMAAGLPAGLVTVVTAPSELVWGQPAASAQVVARLTSGNPTIYGYDR